MPSLASAPSASEKGMKARKIRVSEANEGTVFLIFQIGFLALNTDLLRVRACRASPRGLEEKGGEG